MTYPRTDEDWERLAECIVTRHPSVSPELVGGFTVDATATIFTWYKGEERRKALDERQYARDRLIELARETGCMPGAGLEGEPLWERPKEVVEHGSYVIFTNLDTGETKQYFNIFPPDSPEVVSAAMNIKPTIKERWGKNIKFDIVPAEKLPGGQSIGRPVPQTYGDWSSLGMDIKEKDPSTAVMVNNALYDIGEENEHADRQKQWLLTKAGELGIR